MAGLNFLLNIIINLLLVVFSVNAYSLDAPSAEIKTESVWQLVGPGDADQTTSLSLSNDDVVYLGTDIGGIYISDNKGDSWSSINTGLDNHDITTPIIHDISSKNVLFVGTRGGFYKSDDGAFTWKNIRNGLPPISNFNLRSSVGSIVQDPFSPSRLYLGLGYRPSFKGNATIKKIKWSKSIYVSNDMGESWEALKIFNIPQRVNHIVHSLTNKGELYVATNYGVYKSINKGENWERLYNGKVLNLLLIKKKVGMIIASIADNGLVKSVDGGETWDSINDGLPYGFINRRPNRYSVLTTDASENIIYIVNSTWGRSGGLYASSNYGESWELLTKDMPESWLKTSRKMNAVAVDSKNNIYLGSSRYVYSSEDKGKTWEQLISKKSVNGWSHTGINVFGHTRKVKVAPDNKNVMYVSTADHGMLKSEDAGVSWFVIGKDLEYADNVWDIDVCNNKPDSLFIIGSNIKGRLCVYASDNGGDDWQSFCHDLGESKRNEKIFVEPESCDVLHAVTSSGLMKLDMTDSSLRSVNSGLPKKGINNISFESADKYVATDVGLYKKKLRGNTWIALPELSELKITAVLVSKKDPNVILAGSSLTKMHPARIYRSDDGGKSWVIKLDGIRKYISGFSQLPGNENIIYASTNDFNYHDASGGAGVFRSSDHGLTWKPLNKGLAVLKAFSVDTSLAAPFSVYLSTQGSGAYIFVDK